MSASPTRPTEATLIVLLSLYPGYSVRRATVCFLKTCVLWDRYIVGIKHEGTSSTDYMALKECTLKEYFLTKFRFIKIICIRPFWRAPLRPVFKIFANISAKYRTSSAQCENDWKCGIGMGCSGSSSQLGHLITLNVKTVLCLNCHGSYSNLSPDSELVYVYTGKRESSWLCVYWVSYFSKLP